MEALDRRPVWEIARGEDHLVPTESMRVNLHQRAAADGIKVKTSTSLGGDKLVFQFFKD